MEKEKILKAGEIAKEVKKYIKPLIKKGVSLLEIAEKIENKIIQLGGKPAFPTNLSINEIAAHYTPSYNDEAKAHGLLKVDFGVHVDGWLSDTAFSVDLENSEENKKLIIASQNALKNAIDLIINSLGGDSNNKNTKKSGDKISNNKVANEKDGDDVLINKKIGLVEGGGVAVEKNNLTTNQIGKIISETIEFSGFSPIINLSGHEMKQYDLHAGLNIPNIDDKRETILKKGLYAIEPFATNGSGRVYDGKPSGIYMLTNPRNIRSPLAREILDYIAEEYSTLPFCSRWIVKKFGTRALIGLKQLEDNENLHHYPQLIDSGKGIVAQSENTILIDDSGKVSVTTE